MTWIPSLVCWRQTLCIFVSMEIATDSDLNMVCVAPCDPASVLLQIIGYRFCSLIKVPEYACLPLIWKDYSRRSSEMMKRTSFLFPQLCRTLISTCLLIMLTSLCVVTSEMFFMRLQVCLPLRSPYVLKHFISS